MKDVSHRGDFEGHRDCTSFAFCAFRVTLTWSRNISNELNHGMLLISSPTGHSDGGTTEILNVFPLAIPMERIPSCSTPFGLWTRTGSSSSAGITTATSDSSDKLEAGAGEGTWPSSKNLFHIGVRAFAPCSLEFNHDSKPQRRASSFAPLHGRRCLRGKRAPR